MKKPAEQKGMVTEAIVERMRRWTPESKRQGAVKWMNDREPGLAGVVDDEVVKIVGRVALTGPPPFVAEQLASDLQFLAAKLYIAMDLGHGELWKKEVLAPLKAEPGPAPVPDQGLIAESPGTGKTSALAETIQKVVQELLRKAGVPPSSGEGARAGEPGKPPAGALPPDKRELKE